MAQSSIDFLLNNNISIIQGIFAIIFILVVFVILRSFKKDSEEHVPPRPTTIRERREEEAHASQKAKAETLPVDDSSPLDDLDNLDDLMGPNINEVSQEQIDQTLSGPITPPEPEVNLSPPADFVEAANSATGVRAAAPTKPAPTAELTDALNEKEKVIADLRTEIKNLGEQAPVAGESVDLQAKVKELTEKLSEYEIIEDDIANLSFYKTENIKLKNELEKLKGISLADTEAAIAEINASPAPATSVAEKTAPPLPNPAALNINSDDSILSEFEEAVKQKEILERSIPISDSTTLISANKDEADLLKEFENAVKKELAPTANINSDKLVQEIETLAATTPPVATDDGKDSNQKLIEEFENFVNKN